MRPPLQAVSGMRVSFKNQSVSQTVRQSSFCSSTLSRGTRTSLMSSPSPEVTMSDEDLRCGVCCNDYNRGRRMPRMLHCEHTFCAQCLTKLGINEGSICTVRCPVCRWITCVLACHGSLWIPGGLWINTEIYDKLKQENHLETQKPNLETQKPKVSKPSLDAFKGLFKRQPQDQQSRLTAADGKIAASKEMRPCKRPM